MSPQFPAHRDAEDFARTLEGGASTAVAERYADLVRAVNLLQEQPRPEPRPEFVTSLRERLMAEADVVLTSNPTAPLSLDAHRARRIGRRERHLGAAAAALVLVGATTGMAAAAQGALPGQTLYPLKRGIETVETHLSTSDSTRGQQLLDQAATRLSEVRALVDAPSAPESAGLVGATLNDFTRAADEGSRLLFASYQGSGDAGDIAAVRDFTHGTMDVLGALADSSPQGARSLAAASETLVAIDQQARVLCLGCSDSAPLAAPTAPVALSPAAALQQLVTGPAQAVAPARKSAGAPGDLGDLVRGEAARAQKAASDAASGSPSSSESGTTTTDRTGSRPSGRPTGSSLFGVPASNGGDDPPLRHLISGVTTALPDGVGTAVDGVTGDLGGAVDGVTQGLQQTTDGLTGTLSTTLGTITGGDSTTK